MYSVSTTTRTNECQNEQPFLHSVTLADDYSKEIADMALFDGGALIGAMSSDLFRRIRNRIQGWHTSTKRLRMADGTITYSLACWKGKIRFGNITIDATLEVFDSKGGWNILLGKPLLRALNALQDYTRDQVSVSNDNGSEWTNLKNMASALKKESENVVAAIEDMRRPTLTELRPSTAERIARIQEEVTIGTDITPEQREKVRDTLAKYADCFALDLTEVAPIPGAVHKLNIPPESKFKTKPFSPKWTPDQRKFVHSKVDDMLKAGVIRHIHPRDVKCVSPIVLSKKEHDLGGLPIVDLIHKVNDECIANGLPPAFDLPPRSEPATQEEDEKPTKWRICQNFREINKATEIAPMPQGDIRAKQQRLSGHRYLHVFDFAAGFHAVTIHEDSQPYITFYVEGRGFFAYQRMPFGVTGGPSEFAVQTAMALHDIVAEGTIELFVDDGGAASDTFEESLLKLTTLLERVWKKDCH